MPTSINSYQALWVAASNDGCFETILGDGVNAITAAEPLQDIWLPFAVTLTSWQLTANASGSIQLYLYSCSYAAYDAGATHPVDGDNIVASAPPKIITATKANSGDYPMIAWTTSFSSGALIRIGVTSATTVNRVVFRLNFNRA